jgi:hypothetical protein
MLYELPVDFIYSHDAMVIAVCFSTLASVISLSHVIRHIMYYTMPGIQVYVIRILLIVPVYATTSALALALGHDGMYAEVLRDVMEAVVIYTFLLLMLEFCGGETDCVYQMEDEPMLAMPFPLCSVKRARDARLIHFCQRSVLQFVIIKIVTAATDIVMLSQHLYVNAIYQSCLMFIYNITYTVALYGLMVFYYATKDLIKEFHPVGKFVSVKIIIFFTYFQSVIVSLCPIPVEEALMWNDFILCIEMVLFATILAFAFPVSEFQGGMPQSRVLESVKDIISVSDVFEDVYHSFTPKYNDYTAQRQESEAPTRIGRIGDLDNAATEMSRRYRGRNRRLEFNSLLRGSTPIVATLRSKGSVGVSTKYGPVSPRDEEEGPPQGSDRFQIECSDDEDNDGSDGFEGVMNAIHAGIDRGQLSAPENGVPLRDAGMRLKQSLLLQVSKEPSPVPVPGYGHGHRHGHGMEPLDKQESLEWSDFAGEPVDADADA